MVEFKGFEKFEVVSEEELAACKGGAVVTPVLAAISFWDLFFGNNSGKK